MIKEMNSVISKKYIIVTLLDATIAFDNYYTYLPLQDETCYIGQIVEVPFGRGNSPRNAVIVGESDTCSFSNIKTINRNISKTAIYLPDQIDLAKEMKRRYFCTLGKAFKTISPPTILKVGNKAMKACGLIDKKLATDMLNEDAFTSLQQQRAVEMLLQVDFAFVQEIVQACQVSSGVLKTLEKKGLINFFNAKIDRQEESFDIWHEKSVENLNQDQIKALDGILDIKASQNNLKEALLFGVTGSGKTEVYLRLAQKIIEQNKTVIILVPEISLTPLMISRFINQFSDKVAIWHSRLTITQRFEQWKKIINGEKSIVVGARSAIFSPLQNIGLIIIDEEQENSYISESNPKYRAHDIARIRAIQHDAILVLGSATPSIETFHRQKENKNQMFILPQRAKQAPLPSVELISMKNEILRTDFDGVFSQHLIDSLSETFKQNGQAMLFLNRRGFSSALQCIDCGEVVKCPNCEIPLTRHNNQYNSNNKRLICHYCGHIEPVITTCPACHGEHLISYGIGTQQVEKAFYQHFPDKKAIRMDFDTVVGNNSHLKILTDFREKKANCLIGTQMIAKGHDFPDVQTVGILSVDSLLNTGNYNAEERAFQLITQAAGRSGRSDKQGNVIIQGFDLENYAIHYAAKQDYFSFYDAEIAFRKRAGFPPFQHIGEVIVQSMNEKLAEKEIHIIYQNFNNLIHQNQNIFHSVSLYDLAPAPIYRLRKRFRYRIILKSIQKEDIIKLFHFENNRQKTKGVSVSFDINPDYML